MNKKNDTPSLFRTLYYYTSKDYALQSLRDKRLKVARFTELNDPFDFLGVATISSSGRLKLQPLKDELDKTTGILCMSTTWQAPLLWGHYADKHKGICLQFRCAVDDWEEVKYRKKRPTLRTFGKRFVSDLTKADLHRLSKMKFEQWEYENEFRKFVSLENADLVTGLFFHEFSERMELCKVILGARCEVQPEVIHRLCRHVDPDISLIKARVAHQSFSVLRDTEYEFSL